LPSAIARSKYAYELLLAALECHVEPDLTQSLVGRLNLELDVEETVSQIRDEGPVATLLVDGVLLASQDRACDVGSIAAAIRASTCAEGAAVPDFRSRGQSLLPSHSTSFSGASTVPARPEKAEAPAVFADQSVQTLARRMRSYKMDVHELRNYAAQLEIEIAREPQRIALWKELQYLLIGFMHDLDAALLVVERCLEHHPTDPDARRWVRILRLQPGRA
jgi:hypothetical protein